MFTEKDFKVELVNKEEVKNFIRKHGEFAAVCYNTPIEKAEGVGIHCLKSGHLSGSRHLYFIFSIRTVPRFLVDQLVRHEVGVVKNVQSLRYVTKEDLNVYIPPEIRDNEFLMNMIELDINSLTHIINSYQRYFSDINKERANEIARTLMPIGVESACSFAINLEGLINLCNKRLCMRAELPIRTLVKLMKEEVLAIEPRYEDYLVPQCIKLGRCPELKGCGYIKSLESKK